MIDSSRKFEITALHEQNSSADHDFSCYNIANILKYYGGWGGIGNYTPLITDVGLVIVELLHVNPEIRLGRGLTRGYVDFNKKTLRSFFLCLVQVIIFNKSLDTASISVLYIDFKNWII